MKFDMVSLGPARMDAFVTLPDDDVREVCSIDRQRCVIELGFGDKIPVKSIQFEIGGNTGNNAVGMSRLGYKTAMVGTMGDHWVDAQALEVLKKEGVNVDGVVQIAGAFGFGVIINYQGERTILSYYPDSECNFTAKDDEVQTEWVYLTTAGQDYECFYEDAVKWAKKIGAKIAFNPGSRQVKDGIEKLKYAYDATEILFVNKEEAAKLLRRQFSGEIKELLSGLREFGPKTVVITDGPNGAYVFDGSKYLYMPTVDAPVVERTGAGDAFGSGFLGAILGGKFIEEALKWGACNSASVLGYVGPQAGLLTTEKMQEWLSRNTSVSANEI
jgi:sugar/nucleoside kinase (ribokinase family)